ncbi:NADPH-dependent FMN reductase [Terricaulis silvestris]|uniref:FMN-dependent NADPH-azoreductase n=1 Tax=Terricaulis silvestris TaxID=2686094 RepID=A0A6I6MGJ0_9CAUL|nr:NAD(P)H-dependent oxidoreductase [Terricaulis silvestris]QGZ93795.1 FMN-dependent NADPH-azoreductase [Terricaulis silvestris]
MKNTFIVGIGGTLRSDSSSERALRFCLDKAAGAGARTAMFSGEDLRAPLFEPGQAIADGSMRRLVDALRQADGVIIASPGYHGSISGSLKNVLDYTEEMARDERPYFEGRAVGCIVSAGGWQAAAATLAALRAIVHALRGWPTPLGVLLNSAEPVFEADGRCRSAETAGALGIMTQQVLDFASTRRAVFPDARVVAKRVATAG